MRVSKMQASICYLLFMIRPFYSLSEFAVSFYLLNRSSRGFFNKSFDSSFQHDFEIIKLE
jgi:hypothetical protein